MSSHSVDNWIVGFMTALAVGYTPGPPDLVVDTQYVLFSCDCSGCLLVRIKITMVAKFCEIIENVAAFSWS